MTKTLLFLTLMLVAPVTYSYTITNTYREYKEDFENDFAKISCTCNDLDPFIGGGIQCQCFGKIKEKK